MSGFCKLFRAYDTSTLIVRTGFMRPFLMVYGDMSCDGILLRSTVGTFRAVKGIYFMTIFMVLIYIASASKVTFAYGATIG